MKRLIDRSLQILWFIFGLILICSGIYIVYTNDVNPILLDVVSFTAISFVIVSAIRILTIVFTTSAKTVEENKNES